MITWIIACVTMGLVGLINEFSSYETLILICLFAIYLKLF